MNLAAQSPVALPSLECTEADVIKRRDSMKGLFLEDLNSYVFEASEP